MSCGVSCTLAWLRGFLCVEQWREASCQHVRPCAAARESASYCHKDVHHMREETAEKCKQRVRRDCWVQAALDRRQHAEMYSERHRSERERVLVAHARSYD